MNKDTIGKSAMGFGLSAAVTSVLSSVLVILKDSYAPLLAWMKKALGHHWTTHGAIVLFLFVLLGYVFSRMGLEKKWDASQLTLAVLVSVIVSGILLIGFFFLETLE